MVSTSDLNPVAQAAAERAVAGGLVLTSGRRSVEAQAHAMASNVILRHDWIGRTYTDTAVSEACQKWVNEHRHLASEIASCTAGLLGVLNGFDDADLRHLSWHLSGDAFDCEPDGDDEHLALLHHILSECHAAGSQGKLLTEEGGLVRWHIQVAGGSPIAAAPAHGHGHAQGHAASHPHAAEPAQEPEPEPEQPHHAEHHAAHHAEHHAAHHAEHHAEPEHQEHHAPAFPGTVLHEGASGDEVKTWQERLVALGHSVSTDGAFGPKTEEATKEFQHSKGLVEDGMVGPHTWEAAFRP